MMRRQMVKEQEEAAQEAAQKLDLAQKRWRSLATTLLLLNPDPVAVEPEPSTPFPRMPKAGRNARQIPKKKGRTKR